jgi:hypothetical protein
MVKDDRSVMHVMDGGSGRFELKVSSLTVDIWDPKHVMFIAFGMPGAPGHGQELLYTLGAHVANAGGLPMSR